MIFDILTFLGWGNKIFEKRIAIRKTLNFRAQQCVKPCVGLNRGKS